MGNSIKHTYHIGGMTCGGCVTIVKNKLANVQGVTSVLVDLNKKEAEITSAEIITVHTLQDALKDTHYTIAETSAV
tara:strand:- start:950 stop:1177 length:228 start_codon:yes stop_codon:yes gene_type:complete